MGRNVPPRCLMLANARRARSLASTGFMKTHLWVAQKRARWIERLYVVHHFPLTTDGPLNDINDATYNLALCQLFPCPSYSRASVCMPYGRHLTIIGVSC